MLKFERFASLAGRSVSEVATALRRAGPDAIASNPLTRAVARVLATLPSAHVLTLADVEDVDRALVATGSGPVVARPASTETRDEAVVVWGWLWPGAALPERFGVRGESGHGLDFTGLDFTFAGREQPVPWVPTRLEAAKARNPREVRPSPRLVDPRASAVVVVRLRYRQDGGVDIVEVVRAEVRGPGLDPHKLDSALDLFKAAVALAVRQWTYLPDERLPPGDEPLVRFDFPAVAGA